MVQNNNTLHLNIETKVLKMLEDDTTFRLIIRINGSRPTQVVILKYVEYLIPDLMKHNDEYGFDIISLSDRNSFAV